MSLLTWKLGLATFFVVFASSAPARADEKPPTKIEYNGWFSNPVFSADGKTLVYAQMGAIPFGGRTGPVQIVVWDLAKGKETRKIDGPADDSLIGALALSPDGKRLAMVLWNTSLRIWDLEKGTELGKAAGSQGAMQLRFSPGGDAIAWVRNGDISLTDPANAKEMKKMPQDADGPPSGLAFVGDNLVAGYVQTKVLAGGGKNPPVEHQISYWLRDTTGKKLKSIGETVTDQRKRLEGMPTHSVFVSRDGKKVVLAGDRGVIQWCDPDTGKKTKQANVPWKSPLDDPIRNIAFSADLDIAAVCSAKGTVAFWDVALGKELQKHEVGNNVDHLAISPDGLTVAVTHQTPGRVGAVLIIFSR